MSAKHQQFQKSFRLFKNAVSDVRGMDIIITIKFLVINEYQKSSENVTIKIEPGNIGGSPILNPDQVKSMPWISTETISTILVQDLLDELVQTNPNKIITIVIKMDIETFECRAILGSEEILKNGKIFIPAIFMEWHFALPNRPGHFHLNCEIDRMSRVAKLFHVRGYQPFMKMNGNYSKLKYANLLEWPLGDIVWVHQSVKVNMNAF